MVKKVVKKVIVPKQKEPEVKETFAPELRKSVREILDIESRHIILEAEQLIPRLKELEAFAIKNSRPHKHFFHFQCSIQAFVNQFKRMLR